MNDLLSKAQIKKEFGLTDALIRRLGEPDSIRPNPYYRNAAPPMKLYLRARVEQFIAEHQDEIAMTMPKKLAALKAVETKRQRAKSEITQMLEKLILLPISREEAINEARLFYMTRYEDFEGEVSERALCSFIRHNYTNYEDVLSELRGRVGASELYEEVKIRFCEEIVRHYNLNLSPLEAAF